MNPKTRTEPTMAGDVEYEVVECDGCEYETALENATTAVLIDSADYYHRFNMADEMTLRSGDIDKPYRVFCPKCSDFHLDYPGTNGFFGDVAEHLTGRRDTSAGAMAVICLTVLAIGLAMGVLLL